MRNSPNPHPTTTDPAEMARRRQLAAIAGRVRVSHSLAAVIAEAAFGSGSAWPVSVGARH